MFEALASFFQLIVQPCYQLTGSWWAAIFLFTLFSKVVLMPLSLWCQKNSIVMVQLMPDLFRIKTKYFGDRETIDEEQNKLYKEHHYHALLSLIPLAIQVIILFGLVDVIHSITDSGAPGTEYLGLVPATDGGTAWIMPFAAHLHPHGVRQLRHRHVRGSPPARRGPRAGGLLSHQTQEPAVRGL